MRAVSCLIMILDPLGVVMVFLMRTYNLPSSLPPAIPDGDIFCCEHSFFEMQDWEALETFERRVVGHFRRSTKISLSGQVKIDGC